MKTSEIKALIAIVVLLFGGGWLLYYFSPPPLVVNSPPELPHTPWFEECGWACDPLRFWRTFLGIVIGSVLLYRFQLARVILWVGFLVGSAVMVVVGIGWIIWSGMTEPIATWKMALRVLSVIIPAIVVLACIQVWLGALGKKELQKILEAKELAAAREAAAQQALLNEEMKSPSSAADGI